MKSSFDGLILLLGVSGSGKSTVAAELSKRFGLRQVASYTTRPPRFDGEPGHTFIDYEDYLHMMMEHQFVACTEINGFFYGVDKKLLDDAQIYVIDPDGAEVLLKRYATDKKVYYIYLSVSDEQRLERLSERGTPADVVLRREADDRIAAKAHYVGDKYDFRTYIVNDDLEETIDKIVEITGLRK